MFLNKLILFLQQRCIQLITGTVKASTFMHLADTLSKATYSAFRLYIYFHYVILCVPWELNPQPLRCKRIALPLRTFII